MGRSSPVSSANASADADEQLLGRAKIQTHYLAPGCFLGESQLLEGLSRLHWILAVIVQRRLDMVCPPATAPALARAWPGADLRMVEQGGHSAFGNGLAEALVKGLLRLQGARLVQGIYSK